MRSSVTKSFRAEYACLPRAVRVLGAAEEDVTGGEALAGGEELAVGGMEREGHVGIGAGTHECGAGAAVPAEADDAVEIMQGHAEFCLFFVAHFHGGSVLAQIGFVERDEEGVKVGAHTGDFKFKISDLRVEL